MDNQAEEQLKAALQAKSGQRYAVGVRRQALALVEEAMGRGESLARVAGRLGIPQQTLRRWCQASDNGRLRPVQITPSRSSSVPSPGGYVLVTPLGYRVEGLGLDDVRTLLGGLC